MNSIDPKLTALQFNEYINNRDIVGLSSLMTEDHTFIAREGNGDMDISYGVIHIPIYKIHPTN